MSVLASVTRVSKGRKVARFKMAVRRVKLRYSARETVELVRNDGSDPEDFSDSGSEENIVDSGEEFVPVDLEADSRDSDNTHTS